MSDKNPETLKAELQRRRRVILETSRRADAEIDALRAAERDPEFEEGAQSEHEQFTLARLSETQRREILPDRRRHRAAGRRRVRHLP